jgi:hypothetical protein
VKQDSYIEYLETVLLSLLAERQNSDIVLTDTTAKPPLLNVSVSVGVLKETIVTERTKRRARLNIVFKTHIKHQKDQPK